MIKYLYDSKVKPVFNSKGNLDSVEELEKILSREDFKVIKKTRMRKRCVNLIVGETSKQTILISCMYDEADNNQDLYAFVQDTAHREDMIRIYNIIRLSSKYTKTK